MHLAGSPWCIECMSTPPLHIHEKSFSCETSGVKRVSLVPGRCLPAGPTERWCPSVSGSLLPTRPWDEAPSSQGETFWGGSAWDSRKTWFLLRNLWFVILGILSQSHKTFMRIKWKYRCIFPKCFYSSGTQHKVLLMLNCIKPLSVTLKSLLRKSVKWQTPRGKICCDIYYLTGNMDLCPRHSSSLILGVKQTNSLWQTPALLEFRIVFQRGLGGRN